MFVTCSVFCSLVALITKLTSPRLGLNARQKCASSVFCKGLWLNSGGGTAEAVVFHHILANALPSLDCTPNKCGEKPRSLHGNTKRGLVIGWQDRELSAGLVPFRIQMNTIMDKKRVCLQRAQLWLR